MQLISLLKENRDSGDYPFHMPGHKRRLSDDEILESVYGIDVTETQRLDDLHDPRGIIKEAQERATALFGSDETRFLVNGSTGGILASVTGCVTEGDDILIASNCHRSVYNAVMLSGASLHLITPEEEKSFGINAGISAKEVISALGEFPVTDNRKAVVITSPTYEGIVSDIEGIAKACHKAGAVLIVDAAHGAHFGFSNGFPESAVRFADIVVTSVHKTLPAMTQTALIHIKRECPSRDRVIKMLSVYMTSSPSYVLMASIDSMTSLLEKKGKELFEAYEKRLDRLYKKAEDLKSLVLLRKCMLKAEGSKDHDRGKIVVKDATGTYSGKQLSDLLAGKYGIIPEMAAEGYVILMTGIADTDEGFDRLSDALSDIDASIAPDKKTEPKSDLQNDTGKELCHCSHNMKAAMFDENFGYVDIEHAAGNTAKDMVMIYPPGIPVTVPGEEITERAVEKIKSALDEGLHVTGLKDKEIAVIWDTSGI